MTDSQTNTTQVNISQPKTVNASNSPNNHKLQEVQVVVFELDHEEYAVSIEDVVKVIEIPDITPIPNSPDYILGFINLSGKVISIINLETKFSLTRTDQKTKPTHIIVVEGSDTSFGITVDRVDQVLRVPITALQSAPDIINNKIGQQYIKAVIVINQSEEKNDLKQTSTENHQDQQQQQERILLQLDIKKLLSADEEASINQNVVKAKTTQNQ